MSDTAGHLIREARHRAGLSQVELAREAGITQSVVSAYESGRRSPSFDMMTKLLGAAGAALVIEYVPAIESHRSVPDTPRGRKLLKHRDEILEAVARGGGSGVYVFGSVARGDDGPDSDIDILVDSVEDFSLLELGRLTASLSEVLGERVDVVPSHSLPPHIHSGAMKDAIPL